MPVHVKRPSPLLPPFKRQNRGTGSVLLWMVVALVPMTAFITLAVDWGHAQVVRSTMSASADDIALGVMDAYITGGWTAANLAAVACQADNPVDPGSGITPTVVVTGGTWNESTRVFTPNGSSGTPAVRVVLSCTKANNNAVRLAWGGLIGIRSVDVKVTSIAAQEGGDSGSVSIPSTASLYLAGTPNGTTTVWGDNHGTAKPYEMKSIPVTPGQWLSFSSFSGTSSIFPAGGVGYYDANGNASMPLHHGQNYNSVPNSPGPENGVADACMPASAVAGLFLSDDPPGDNPAPATVDWTAAGNKDQPVYGSLQLQQPFLIGDGKTSGGTVQKFRVPPGATRMYLSVWDGVQQNNNGGTINGTIQSRLYARLVK